MRIVHIAIQEMSAVRHPTVLKTSTFSIQDCENTFNMSAIYPIASQNYDIYSKYTILIRNLFAGILNI